MSNDCSMTPPLPHTHTRPAVQYWVSLEAIKYTNCNALRSKTIKQALYRSYQSRQGWPSSPQLSSSLINTLHHLQLYGAPVLTLTCQRYSPADDDRRLRYLAQWMATISRISLTRQRRESEQCRFEVNPCDRLQFKRLRSDTRLFVWALCVVCALFVFGAVQSVRQLWILNWKK